jgi:hypothetical protein
MQLLRDNLTLWASDVSVRSPTLFAYGEDNITEFAWVLLLCSLFVDFIILVLESTRESSFCMKFHPGKGMASLPTHSQWHIT